MQNDSFLWAVYAGPFLSTAGAFAALYSLMLVIRAIVQIISRFGEGGGD